MNRSLLSADEKGTYYTKFNLDGLLRGEYESRMRGNAVARQNGWMTANEIRAFENLPPHPDGDELLVNGNMMPARLAGAQYMSQMQNADANKEGVDE